MTKKSRSVVPKLSGGMELEKGSIASPFVKRSSMPRVEGVIVKSMSPMLKAINWPKIDGENAVLVGVFTKVFQCGEFKGDKKESPRVGTGIEIVPALAQVGVAIPVTATLRTGLEIKGDGDDATSPYLGRTVEIELLPERIKSKKGQAAWHFIVGIHPEV